MDFYKRTGPAKADPKNDQAKTGSGDLKKGVDHLVAHHKESAIPMDRTNLTPDRKGS